MQNFIVGETISDLMPVNIGGKVPESIPGTVSTLAGDGSEGSINGSCLNASFNMPYCVAADKYGNVYVADVGNYLIRKINPLGLVTTLAGNGVSGYKDGAGPSASFRLPWGIAVDHSGNVLVADMGSNTIRKINNDGFVTTFAGNGRSQSVDGIGASASFYSPIGLALDDSGNVYVSEKYYVRKINPTGLVTTLAGNENVGKKNGLGSIASFNSPYGIVSDNKGNLFVADQQNHLIRKITAEGLVTTFAGSGSPGAIDNVGTLASFYFPSGIAIDVSGNFYVVDQIYGIIRKITPDGEVSTFAGWGIQGYKDGIGEEAIFNYPFGIAADNIGNLYVADLFNNRIRKISLTGYSIKPDLPQGLKFNPMTGRISGIPTKAIDPIEYTVTATNEFGSSDAKIKISVKSLLVKLDREKIRDFEIKYSEGEGLITLHVKNGTSVVGNIALYNLLGAPLFNIKVTDEFSEYRCKLVPGIYLVKLSLDGREKALKFEAK